MREASLSRETKETLVRVWVRLDGKGDVRASTGIGFFDHMLETMLYYASFDSEVTAREKREVGGHHAIEDVGLVLGSAIREALGEAYSRFGYAVVPMDESLALVSIDISGRPRPVVEMPGGHINGVSVEDLAHFIESVSSTLRASIHVMVLRRGNLHHTVEAVFKALGLSLGQATRPAAGVVSLKGVI